MQLINLPGMRTHIRYVLARLRELRHPQFSAHDYIRRVQSAIVTNITSFVKNVTFDPETGKKRAKR